MGRRAGAFAEASTPSDGATGSFSAGREIRGAESRSSSSSSSVAAWSDRSGVNTWASAWSSSTDILSIDSSSSEVEMDAVAVGRVPLALRFVLREAAGDLGDTISSADWDCTTVKDRLSACGPEFDAVSFYHSEGLP